MIRSFRCDDTHDMFVHRTSKRWSSIHSVALRKLDQMEAAVRLDDLKMPPGDKLEALKGARRGQHSIRVNDQWRICFIWKDDGAYAVEMVDYH